jgi:L-iditol 2-dehydrogenase
MKNKVLKLVDIGKVEIFEEQISKLKDEEILIKIKSTGICGSDMHYFKEGGLGSFKSKLPMYMGHEPSGIVVDKNKSKVYNNEDRVAIEPGMPNLKSFWSTRGRHNLCESGSFMGANSAGAFADYVIVQDLQLSKIPNSMSFDLGALMEPLGVCLHTANLMKPFFTDTAVILGAGSIGLCMLSILKKIGLKDVFLIDKLKYRANFAEKQGATNAFTTNQDFVSEIKKITKGFGAQICIDTGGTYESIKSCIDLSSVGGKVGLIGIPEVDEIKYNPHQMRVKELQLYNVRRSNQTLHDCIYHYSENSKIKDIISHNFLLEDAQKAFELTANYEDEVIKCMINP